MDRNSIKAMSYSSILSAIAVVLYYLNIFPIFQFVTILLCPLPLLYIGYSFDIKYSVLSVLSSSTVVGFILGPFESYFYFSGFALPGIIAGILLAKKMSSERRIIYGTFILLVISMAGYYGVEQVFGMEDAIKDMKTTMLTSVDQINLYLDSSIKEMQTSFSSLIYFLKIIRKYIFYNKLSFIKMLEFPLAFFGIYAFCSFYLIWIVGSVVMRRFKIIFPPLPDLFMIPAPKEIGISGIILFILTLLSYKFNFFEIYIFNIFLCFYFIFFMYGLTLFAYIFHKLKINFIIRLLLTFLILSVHPIICFGAVLDSLFNFRKVYKLTKEEIEKIKRTGIYKGVQVADIPKNNEENNLSEDLNNKFNDKIFENNNKKNKKKRLKFKATKRVKKIK